MEFARFLLRYHTLAGECHGADFEFCKHVNRLFALERLCHRNAAVNELMLIYNMAAHLSCDDPAGIWYVLDMISGPNPKLRIDMSTFGKLLCEMGTEFSSETIPHD